MAAVSRSFVTLVSELLAGAGAVATRRMFGGHGVYLDGLFIGIIAGDVLYLKADARTVGEFETAGSTLFHYTGQGRMMALQFWSAPDEAMESPQLMRPWARLAVAAALSAKAAAREKNRPLAAAGRA